MTKPPERFNKGIAAKFKKAAEAAHQYFGAKVMMRVMMDPILAIEFPASDVVYTITGNKDNANYIFTVKKWDAAGPLTVKVNIMPGQVEVEDMTA